MRTSGRPLWLSPKILAVVSVACFVLFIVSASRAFAATTVEVKVGGEFHGSPLAPGGVVWFNGYDFESIIIRPGDTVEWQVIGGTHTVTSTEPSNATDFVWDSSRNFTTAQALEDMGDGFLLPPGSIYELNTGMLAEGTYTVSCKIHPGMVGSLTVTAGTGVPFIQTAIAGWGDHLYAVQAFLPEALTVSRGTIVRWTLLNPLEPHTITGANETGAPAWDSSPDLPSGIRPSVLREGQAFSWTFNEPGTFTYFCKLHAYKIGDSWVGMVGTVHVVPYSALDAATAISGTAYLALVIGVIALAVALFGTARTFRKPKAGAPPP
jgi:plastocyanin